TTQLQDREIIFGKLGSRVTSMLMLILSGIPIIAITMLMGGVNPTTLLYAMIATLLNLFCTSALAIYMSTTTRTTIGALVRTYWWLLFWIILFPLIVILLTEFGLLLFQDAAVYISVQRAHYQHWGTLTFAITNPVTSFVASGDLSTANRMASMLGPCYFLWLLIIPFGIGCVLIYFSIRSVRHEPKSSYWLQQLRNAVRKPFSVLMHWLLLKPVTRHLFQLLPPDRAEVVLGKPVNNPLWFRSRVAYVYDREKHLQGAQKAAWFIAVLAVIGIAFLERNTLNSCIFAQMFLCWFWIGIFVAGCLVAGLSFANDRRNGFFEFVLVSPLSPKEVLWGTYLGVWRHI
ncbi:MAG TPA: hypothetical protein PKA06_16945, partial [Gemmatales bacterium]|nr:hypothetical protein [Gemmatales bacterium]